MPVEPQNSRALRGDSAPSSRTDPAEPMTSVRVLVVEDEVVVRRAVIRQLRDPAFSVVEAALEQLALGGIDVVLADVMMPRLSGMELLRRVRESGLDVEVIMMTAHNDLSLAFEAVQAGAFYFLKKPFSTEELRVQVLRASERRRMLTRTRQLEAELDGTRSASRLVGTSRAMRDVREFVLRVAPLQATVFITGENGTGKEVLARELHARSTRSRKPFVAFNCGALNENLIGAQLFGSLKGAFTGAEDRAGYFEAADGGTVFLDEIGDLPKSQQTHLLRVIQERKVTRVGDNRERDVDVRLIAATNVDIKAAVSDGRFRTDLYHRLKVHEIEMPALRERREDVQLLAYHFIAKHGPRANPGVKRLSPIALRALESYSWPGNVRELENTIEAALGHAHGETLELEALSKDVQGAPLRPFPAQEGPTAPGVATSLDYAAAKRRAVTEFDRAYFNNVMEVAGRNISRAARLAGLDRSNFRRMLRRALGEVRGVTDEGDESE